MRILTLENEFYNLETLPDEIDDLRFAILDNSNPQNVDYHYIPLIFLVLPNLYFFAKDGGCLISP